MAESKDISPNQKLKAEARLSLERYQRERRRSFILNAVGYILITVTLCLFIMIFSGGQAFDGLLSALGLPSLYHRESGIFADCSRRENRDNELCYPKPPLSNNAWGPSSDKSGAFSLNER